MIVLGLDTATQATAVALSLADGSTGEARDDPALGAHPGHATRLLEMARELLDAAEAAWSELDRLAVGLGPGTFTGLRVGVATARGLAQSLSLELVGVSSLQALAQATFEREESVEACLAVIDARRGEAFAAAYERDASGAPVELLPPAALAPEQLAGALAAAGGSERSWLAVGDGALRFREQLHAAHVPTPAADSPLHLLRARAICTLGASSASVGVPEAILPDYCRRPDAELALGGAAAPAESRP